MKWGGRAYCQLTLHRTGMNFLIVNFTVVPIKVFISDRKL